MGNEKIKASGEEKAKCGWERGGKEDGVGEEGESKSESGRERESKYEKLREIVERGEEGGGSVGKGEGERDRQMDVVSRIMWAWSPLPQC